MVVNEQSREPLKRKTRKLLRRRKNRDRFPKEKSAASKSVLENDCLKVIIEKRDNRLVRDGELLRT
jgi:hypothetical protein